jgi:hypothetical protein
MKKAWKVFAVLTGDSSERDEEERTKLRFFFSFSILIQSNPRWTQFHGFPKPNATPLMWHFTLRSFLLKQISMADHAESSPLVPPIPLSDPSSIDLEAGPSEQIQCRICLETDGNFNFSIFVFRLSQIVLLR